MERSRKNPLSKSLPTSQDRPLSPGSGTVLRRPASPREKSRSRSPLQIFIMRHGIAVKQGPPPSGDDASRTLTPKGKKRIKQIAEGLQKLSYELDWIVTSPLVRASETAEIVAASYATRVPVDVCAALSPGGSMEDLFSFLARHRNRRRILLVGHEPDLSALAAGLIGAKAQAKLAFKKGGCCLIQGNSDPRSGGKLVWWLPPRLLRAIH